VPVASNQVVSRGSWRSLENTPTNVPAWVGACDGGHRDSLIGMWSLGANLGATRANDFPRQANGYGQAGGDLASSRTDPDDAERLTGIYGLEGLRIGRKV
jgi:hypothetical protein